ncbi:hypothetical protein STENM223S_08205 [Streptomyces tendae]
MICAVAPRSTEIQPGSVQPVVGLVAHREAGSRSKARAGAHSQQLPSLCDEEAAPVFP